MADEQEATNAQDECELFDIPNEITEEILSYLSSYGELQQAKLVCKAWHALVLRIITRRKRIFYESVCNGSLYFQTIPQRFRISPRYSHSSCVLGKSMYVFGGCSPSNTAFNDIHELDLKDYKWSRLRLSGISPPPKECASMVAHKNRIIIFGGWCLSPRTGIVSNARFHNGVNVLDVPSLTWSITPLNNNNPDLLQPCERAGHAACVLQDQMIVFGGAQRLTRYNDVWMLDLNLMHWTMPRITGKRPSARFGHSQMVMDPQTLIIIGGWGNQLFNDVWLLHLKTMTWTEVQVYKHELEAPQIWCHPAVKVHDKIVIFSSSSEPSNNDSNTNEVLTLQTYTLDCSQVLTQGSCTWQPRNDAFKKITATSLHSVVKGREEFFIFGGRTNLLEGAWKIVNTLVKVTPRI
ncbi:F-box only protein 42 [Exaiptasia diaphana]|uniref:F-box domain-containing protein n=1 Tax=Exaiptasia diaphana TaxID=2652724 RepID=A0A913Y2E4_EXADI|nr:F-box only protein 42 [Exaiptasia diaphana]